VEDSIAPSASPIGNQCLKRSKIYHGSKGGVYARIVTVGASHAASKPPIVRSLRLSDVRLPFFQYEASIRLAGGNGTTIDKTVWIIYGMIFDRQYRLDGLDRT